MDLQDLDAINSINVLEDTFNPPYATVSLIICDKFEFLSRNIFLQDVIVMNVEQLLKYVMRTACAFAGLILVVKNVKCAKQDTISILNVSVSYSSYRSIVINTCSYYLVLIRVLPALVPLNCTRT